MPQCKAPTCEAKDQCFVTLATNDMYATGALVLGRSLRNTCTTRNLVVMVTDDVSMEMRHQLSRVFDVVTVVDELDSREAANLELLTRPELGVTFTKLHCWKLTQFCKCVFLDADTLVSTFLLLYRLKQINQFYFLQTSFVPIMPTNKRKTKRLPVVRKERS